MKTLLTVSFLLTISCAIAQNEYPYPSLSPLSKLSQQIGNTSISVEYERPSARKREVFGDLVPWNKLWRTGAGHCTKIRFDKPVIVEGQPIPAGHYSLFTIPNPETWIVILNKDTTLYGSSFYKPENDIARFSVIPKTTDRHYETLTIDIDLIPNNARMYISWVNTQIGFDILTSTDKEIIIYIQKEVITEKSTDPNIYAGAAAYMLYQGVNLKQALTTADKAIQLDKNSWARNIKLDLLEVLGYYNEAIEMTKREIETTKTDKYEREKDRADRIRELEASIKNLKNKQ